MTRSPNTQTSFDAAAGRAAASATASATASDATSDATGNATGNATGDTLLIEAAHIGRAAASSSANLSAVAAAASGLRIRFAALVPVAQAINPSLTDDCVALIYSVLRGIDADADRFADSDIAVAPRALRSEPVHEERLDEVCFLFTVTF